MSLSALAQTRESLDVPVFLSGTIVSPFPQMQRPKENPFLCKQQSAAPMKRKTAAQTRKRREDDEAMSVSDAEDVPAADYQSSKAIFTANAIGVLSFGTVTSREKYFTPTLLFPVGYRSRRSYWSIYRLEWKRVEGVRRSERLEYVSEIVDGGEAGPLFRVYPECDPSDVMESASSSGAWRQVLQRVKELREAHGEPASGTAVSGEVVRCG